MFDKNQGFSFFEGSFIKDFKEGNFFLLDEVNLALKTILQFMESRLDSREIYQ